MLAYCFQKVNVTIKPSALRAAIRQRIKFLLPFCEL